MKDVNETKVQNDLTKEQLREMALDVICLSKKIAEMNEFVYLVIDPPSPDNTHHVSFHVKMKSNTYVETGIFTVTDAFITLLSTALCGKYKLQTNNTRSHYSIWLPETKGKK